MEPNLSQALHLLNGEATARKIRQGKVPSTLYKPGKDIAGAVRELYVRSFSRAPTEKEMQGIVAYVQEAESPETGLEDAFWALLNAKEFMFNH